MKPEDIAKNHGEALACAKAVRECGQLLFEPGPSAPGTAAREVRNLELAFRRLAERPTTSLAPATIVAEDTRRELAALRELEQHLRSSGAIIPHPMRDQLAELLAAVEEARKAT